MFCCLQAIPFFSSQYLEEVEEEEEEEKEEGELTMEYLTSSAQPIMNRQSRWVCLTGTRFTNFTRFLLKNPASLLLVPLSGILPIACPLTWQDISDNSRAILQFY
jgi:hypothetical protein